MSAFAVKTHNLGKTYPPRRGWRKIRRANGTTAVRNVDLAVREGELFGLLGPNGAGKTTLVKMLCTLIMPTDGTATVAGHSLQAESAIRSSVGLVVTDERSFFWRLSVRRNLRFFAAMHNMFGTDAERRIDEVLDAVNLLDRSETRFSDFSTGMRQRVAIARGLLHRPKILFLDEPSRSLDPTATNQLHELIHDIMQRRGMTVFLITHDLAEAEKLCDRIAVMHQGRVRAVGKADELRQKLQPYHNYTVVVNRGLSSAEIPTIPTLTVSENQLTFQASDNSDQLTEIIDHLRTQNIDIKSINAQPPTLEEVFTHLTQ